VLTSNRITELADLDPLSKLRKLTHLVLLDNPVVRKAHYRSWMIWRCRALRFLDFTKVRNEERLKADQMFGVVDGELTDLARRILSVKSAAATNLAGSRGYDDDGAVNGGAGSGTGGRMKLSATERRRVEEAVRNATSLAEIERLERELNEGRIPRGLGDDDVMEE
jgi:U2 small nuclear ribonucleoprotein A'